VPRAYLVAIAAVLALGAAAWAASAAGLLRAARGPLVETPEAVAAGEAVYRYRCHGCHRDVPLEKRVAGWTADRAYAFIGVQQDYPRALMPRFPGTDDDRRALAIWIQALGAGRVSSR
jgi:mono/diheme cytochrome c family protein